MLTEADNQEGSNKTRVAEPHSRVRLPFLDGLRGLAALYVVVHHAWLQTWPVVVYGDAPSGLIGNLTDWLIYGHFAVTLFIVLSGFCLTLPVLRHGGTLRQGAKTFFYRRAQRILPPYYAALALSLLLTFFIAPASHTLYDASLPVTKKGVLTHLLLIHNLFPNTKPQINGPLWSIAVECQIYLFFPLLVWLWKRAGPLTVTCAALLTGYAGFFILRNKTWEGITPHYYGLFAVGMLGATLCFSGERRFERMRERLPWKLIASCAFALLCLCCRQWPWLICSQRFWLLDLVVSVGVMAMLIACRRSENWIVTRLLSARWLVTVGMFSYSLYLIHFPLQQIFWQCLTASFHFGKGMTFALVTLVGTPALLFASWLFFRVFERPFLPDLARNQELRQAGKASEEARTHLTAMSKRKGLTGLAFLLTISVLAASPPAMLRRLQHPLGGAAQASASQRPFSNAPETTGGWIKNDANPVLGGALGTCFDVSVLHEGTRYRMWFSWRPRKSVALVESADGVHWSAPVLVLEPNPADDWEADINRPVVVRVHSQYHMWYTGQAHSQSRIGHAVSKDGKVWTRDGSRPVLVAETGWEKGAVMCPHVLYDDQVRLFRMWYSAGDQYEPDAIGYATSRDGHAWTKDAGNPIFTPDKTQAWESHKVTACDVVRDGKWYEMFYIGFRDENQACIGLARSRDGVHDWQRLPANPIIRPGSAPGAWDYDAVYKPAVVKEGNGWLLWYNGRIGGVEQIGQAAHAGSDLWNTNLNSSGRQ